jgi:hypothetical protein
VGVRGLTTGFATGRGQSETPETRAKQAKTRFAPTPSAFGRIGVPAGYCAFAAPQSVAIGAANIRGPNGTTVSLS